MIFREDNPISSLSLLLGIPESLTSNLWTNMSSELFPNFTNRRVEVVMMPKNDSRNLVREGVHVDFGEGIIQAIVPVPFEIGLQASEGQEGKASNLWKGKYVPALAGSVQMMLNLTYNQT